MILQNGRVLQYKNGGIAFFYLDIRIQNHIIQEIGEHLCPIPSEKCLDLNGNYVLPGMVNSHYHSYTNILRGTSAGEPLEIWSADTVALGKLLTPEDMSLSVSLGICEMLRSGVTSCVDHLPHLGTAGSAGIVYQNAGFRVALAPMLHNIADCDLLYGIDPSLTPSSRASSFPTTLEYMDFYKDYIHRFHHPKAQSQVILGINSPQRTTNSLLYAAADLSETYHLGIHCHLLETKWQRLSADKQGISPLKQLDKFSLLHRRTSLAHCIWLNESELDLLAERGAVSVANPTSNHFLGSGIFPIEKFLMRNIPIALGSDGVNCGTNHNMLEILRFFLLLQRTASSDDSHWLTSQKAYQMVTVHGASVLGLKHFLGEIKPGFLADLVVADSSSFLDLTDNSLSNQLLFHNNLIVTDVFIHGRHVMNDHKILTIDEDNLKKAFFERMPSLKKSIDDALRKSKKEKDFYRSAYQHLWANKL